MSPGRIILLAAVLVSLAAPAAAQLPEFNSFHTWSDVATIVNLNERWRYDGDYGLRGIISDDDWSLLYIRPSVRYRATPWMTAHGGMALFYNFFPGEDLPEMRPWLGVRFVGPKPGGWTISNYLRLEYRAFYLKSTSEWDASFRGRWQLQAVTPDFRIGKTDRFYGVFSIEPFVEIGNSVDGTFGDRFRFNAGLGRRVSDSLRMDVNYVFHTLRLPVASGTIDLDDHVLRVRFYYTFKSRK